MKHIFIILALSCVAFTASAGTYEVTQLTTNNVFDGYPEINKRGDIAFLSDDGFGFALRLYDEDSESIINFDHYPNNFLLNDKGDIAWDEWDGTDYEIFRYDGKDKTITQLTNNDFNDKLTDLNKKGDAVWSGKLGAAATVYLFNKASNTVKALEFPDATRNGFPLLNKQGDVAWQARVGTDFNPDILLYNAENGVIRMVSNDLSFDSNHQIDNEGNVAWGGTEGFNNNIFLYDYATQQIKQLSIDNESRLPMMNIEGDVLWTSGGFREAKHFFYDADSKETTQIGGVYFRPRLLSLNKKGDIVWQALEGTQNTVYYYNSKTQAIEILVAHNTSQGGGVFDLEISDNGDVAYSLNQGFGFEVFAYDGKDKTTTQLTNNNFNDGILRINKEGDIVWTYFDPIGFGEIMFAEKD